MSVLIKGMEMPKDGTYSIVYIYSDGHVSMPFWGKGVQIVSGITAVPVPPHGRLIIERDVPTFLWWLKTVPTLIEEEEEK